MSKPSINWKKFGQEVMSRRAKSGLTIRELAGDLSISHGTISRAEHGKPLSAAHYVLLCSFIAHHPESFLR